MRSTEVRYKNLGESILVKMFGYSPKLRIINIFLTNQYLDFGKEELAKELGMSKQTLYKHFKDLRAGSDQENKENRKCDDVQN
jgi:DNA-binding XRE family transcriptional regulator